MEPLSGQTKDYKICICYCVTIDVTKKEIKDNKRYSSVATTVALVCYFVDIVACCLSCELVIVGLKQVKNISVISCQNRQKYTALRSKSKDWLTLNHDDLSEWNIMSTVRLFFQ
jgi:hypothetical protein